MPTPRRNDLVAVSRSSHILLVVPVLASLNYLAVAVLAGEKLPGRAYVGRPVKLHGLCWPIGNCIFWVDGYLCLGISLEGASGGGENENAGHVSGIPQLGLQMGGAGQGRI